MTHIKKRIRVRSEQKERRKRLVSRILAGERGSDPERTSRVIAEEIMAPMPPSIAIRSEKKNQ